MSYPSLLIAGFFIGKAKQKRELLTPMKLIKLVYFAHGWYLALLHEPLIDEPIEAWQYGPVIPTIYHVYKKFGNEAISEPIFPFNPNQDFNLNDDNTTKIILDKVWDVYQKFSAVQLSNMSHEKDSPWDIAWHQEDGKNKLNHIISNDLIERCFSPKKSEKANGNT